MISHLKSNYLVGLAIMISTILVDVKIIYKYCCCASGAKVQVTCFKLATSLNQKLCNKRGKQKPRKEVG